MNVQPSSGQNPTTGISASGFKPAVPPKAEDQASFQNSEALNNALNSTPDVRPEVVTRAKDLVSSSIYPPPRVIRQISTLLAIGIASQEKS